MDRFVWNEFSVYKYFFTNESEPDSDTDHEHDLAGNRKNQFKKSFSDIFLYLALLFAFIVFFFVNKVENSLPKPLKLHDLEDYPKEFNAERAQLFLKKLTDIGPRVVGSKENEDLAVVLITNELQSIISGANASQTIDIDYQTMSGSYYLQRFVNVYENVKNIVVRLRSGSNSSHNILVNCHYDSVPTSPGGSDNGINCAAMLEVLRVLSQKAVAPQHNLIFLFNGAEESPLQASHGFITNHNWAKNVRLFINLDACGAGGKEVLFQTGPNTPWLLRQYSKAIVHPSAQSFAEEIFQSGLIPSDTDFRVFRDFGHIPGIDLAFYKNGYVYHTKYDGFRNIPLGSYQHIGDNLLSLVDTIANAELDVHNLNISAFSSKMVYFDIFGQFLIAYSDSFAVVLNTFAICVSVFVAYNHNDSLKTHGLHVLFLMVSWFFSFIGVLVVAFLFQYFERNMSWFNHTWNLFGTYYLSTIAASAIFLQFLFKRFRIGERKYTIEHHIQSSIHACRLIFTSVLFVCTIFAIRSSYIFVVPVLANSIICHYVFNSQRTTFRRHWTVVYFISQTILSSFGMHQALMFTNLIVPITGRIGATVNSELLVAVLSFLLCILVFGLTIPMVMVLKNARKSCCTLFTICALNAILILFTPIGFPYRVDIKEPVPQRYYIDHAERIFYNFSGSVIKKDSGFFFVNMDINSPSILNYLVEEIGNNDYDNAIDCENFIFCGLPVYDKRTIVSKKTWIPTEYPIIPKQSNLKLSKREQISEDVERFHFLMTGPSKAHLMIWTADDAEIVNWSFIHHEVNGTETWLDGKEQPIYFVWYSNAKPSSGSDFSVDIRSNLTSAEPMLNVVLYAKFTYHQEHFTKKFNNFLNAFPDWAQISPSISTYQSYIF